MAITVVVAVCLAAGIILGSQPWPYMIGLAISGLLLLLVLLFWKRSWQALMLPVLLFLVAGCGALLSAHAWAAVRGMDAWPYPEGEVWSGIVSGTPRWGEQVTRFVVVSPAGRVQIAVPQRMYLLPGDRIEFQDQPIRPKTASNPGEFDYRFYLTLRKVSWTLMLNDSSRLIRYSGSAMGLSRLGAALAYRWQNVFTVTLPKKEAGLLSSLVLGQREDLDPEIEGAIDQTGLHHLLAVSGFHVGYAVLLAGACGQLLGMGESGRGFLQLICTWIFAAACGFRSGVMRAAVMVSFSLGIRTLKKRPDPVAGLSIAAICLLIFQPLFLFDTGFQLSFAATVGLLAGRSYIPRFAPGLKGWLQRSVMMSLLVQAAVAPLAAFHFHRIVWTVPFTQLFLAPLMGLGVLLGLAAGWLGMVVLPLASAINACCRLILQLFSLLVIGISRWPYHGINVPSPPLWMIICWYGILALIWRKRTLDWAWQPRSMLRYGLVMLVLVVVFWYQQLLFPFPEAVRVTVLDVGQGDALVVQTRSGHSLLIDGGVRWEDEFKVYDQGARVVIPFLRQAGVNQLDVLYSHAHDDHIGGLISVISSEHVQQVWGPSCPGDTDCYFLFRDTLAAHQLPVQYLQAGNVLQLGSEAELRVLSPPEGGISGGEEDPNNQSLVLMLTVGHGRMLFTGDLEAEGIRWLLATAADLEADILKVPHHGSSHSYNRDFYRRVSPRYALISVGPNCYGHPGDKVVQHLAHSAQMLRTDHDGAVMFRFFPAGIRMQTYRKDPDGFGH